MQTRVGPVASTAGTLLSVKSIVCYHLVICPRCQRSGVAMLKVLEDRPELSA